MNLAYIVLCHTLPQQVVRLVRRLDDEHVTFLVHVDRRAADTVVSTIEMGLSDLENVRYLPRRACRWGSSGTLAATLEGVSTLVRDGTADYGILLSGQDYPLWNPARIRSFFEMRNGASFIEWFPTDDAQSPWGDAGRRRYERWHLRRAGRHLHLPRPWRARPADIFFGGSAYWCLSRQCLGVIDAFMTHVPSSVRYFNHVDSPDEIFFQTALGNSPARSTLVNDDLRYIDWSARRSHPAVLTTADFAALETSMDLYARKFDVRVDSRVLDLIDDDLLTR